eukprot:INCI961.1.p1 GENE.INCI961.1~~INCI961.1.p1  ORF type:complete len:430 (-),score=47.29 INCI961.1:74-1363(-)
MVEHCRHGHDVPLALALALFANAATCTSAASAALPLFVTFDAGIPVENITREAAPFVVQEQFVWGAEPDPARISAWRAANPRTELSYYLPYSRSPAASLGFDLAFWQREHPDWVLYQCDRKTVAFWDGETAPTGSVPLDFTNPDVAAWQVSNQSVLAQSLGFDSMAFDNFGGGARQGAIGGQACGVFLANGSWSPRFDQSGPTFDPTRGRAAYQEASVAWLETVSKLMANQTPGLGIVPNICVGPDGWGASDAARRVAAASTGMLSERGFTGWASERIGKVELLDEYAWMESLAAAGKQYYSINEVTSDEWSEAWVEWIMAAFMIGQTNTSALWLGLVQAYGAWSYFPQLGASVGLPSGPRTEVGAAGLLLLRTFTGGLALLNPTTEADQFQLPASIGTLQDLAGHTIVAGSTLAIPAQSGRVLIFEAA